MPLLWRLNSCPTGFEEKVFMWRYEVYRARLWWLTPIILATQEAEIRRIKVQSEPRKIVHGTLSQKKSITKKELVEWVQV
jgi:hypothetical protein